jgi:hypothetical protein
VALHGLYEDDVETWTDPQTGTLWLRDLFPHEKYNVRVLTYGYKAESLSTPGQGTTDRLLAYANSFVAELCAERELSNSHDRPIIFICHGFGGILVKRALVLSSTSKAKNVEHRRSIYISTYAIIFMGTPHAGMSKNAILIPQHGNRIGPGQFMLNLLPRSEMLQDITDQFAPLMNRFSVYYFWEQVETRAGAFIGYIVDAESAAPAINVVDRCGIMATHSGMAKFKSRGDNGYQVVLGALARCIKAAPELVRVRWIHDQQILAEERWNEADERRREAEKVLSSLSLDSVTTLVETMDSNEIYLVRHRSSHYFTGRRRHAELLKDKFLEPLPKHKRHEHHVFVVYGLGGSGKTQFCLKYAEDNASR